ncbi:MAG: DUF4390 domain-containing protein, partial [Deltaproteobacteria bacterium]|nr:DUF4390 domain-containing protein [Deltaproteobacteria bacterium]
FSFFLMITLSSAAVEQRGGATIEELTATTSENHLILFCILENSFTKEMIEVLHSGIPLRFTFHIELHKTAENWPGELMTALSLQHTMVYDTLKESYRVTLEEEKNRTYSFRSLSEAEKAINEINGAKIVELSQLIPDKLYKLMVRAEIYRKTLPMGLRDVLPFFSWGDVETDWHTIEFRY